MCVSVTKGLEGTHPAQVYLSHPTSSFTPSNLLSLYFFHHKEKSNPCISLGALPPFCGKVEAVPSITLSLLHQHQIGLQPAWHSADSPADWTHTRSLPPVLFSTICRWLIVINEFEWNATNGRRNKLDCAAWQYVPAVGEWRSGDLLFTTNPGSCSSSAWDSTVAHKKKRLQVPLLGHYIMTQRKSWHEKRWTVMTTGKLTGWLVVVKFCLLTPYRSVKQRKRGDREREQDWDVKRDRDSET